ncbi:YlzJ-like family protein [Cytobacillus praedii]|uniref:YlzJ-like family protein n=1 Tax=Cytobacillus praedii TaxID=1742358 RepID=UPI002E1D8E00|nr:YlzJ-like family protein [Cytobacillus praedii]MED3573356.1 YlzJ-like family protein [Cytobacillus praedii]
MILYTSMPHELVFPTEAAEFSKQKVVTYNGIPLLVEMDGGQDCTVVRVMSSDPTHFMDDKYTPGTKITLA